MYIHAAGTGWQMAEPHPYVKGSADGARIDL
jgi:hypothetical protein